MLAASQSAETETETEAVCEIWPENRETVLTFLDHSQRWRKSFLEMSDIELWIGFYWADLLALLRETIPDRTRRREVVEGLQIMEAAALPILNKPK